MKKIAFVTPWYGNSISGGAEAETREIVKHLIEYGVGVEILTTCVKDFNSDWNTNYYNEGFYTEAGVNIQRFSVRVRDAEAFDKVNYKFMNNLPVTKEEEDIYFSEMVRSDNLIKYIIQNQDSYHCFVFIPYMFGTTYWGIRAVPEKSVIIPCLHDESYAYMQRLKDALSKAKGMIFHAKPEFELANRIYDLSKVDAKVLGEGINTEIEFNADRFREKYNIKSQFVLYAGRKDAGKKVDLLIEYFCKYKSEKIGNDLKLILIGGGEIGIPRKYEKDIIDLGFIPVQDKYDAFSAAELFCLPSTNESFSIVIMESWLCGTPVLVNAKCEVTKYYSEVSNGGLCFEDYYEFYECLEYIESFGGQKLADNGRRFVQENFNWKIIVKRYTDYFFNKGN